MTDQRLIADSPEERKKNHHEDVANIILAKNCQCNDVLIVDDNECNLFVLQSYLKSLQLSADKVMLYININKIGIKWTRSSEYGCK